MENILYVVVPCYKEEAVIPEISSHLCKKFNYLIQNNTISSLSKIMFVNDGSTDMSWEIICDLHDSNTIFAGINLSKNRGHQNALLAGLMECKDMADVIISMDADMQHDINTIDIMLEKYKDGYDVVYGVRNNRESDNLFKRVTAESFYKLMQALGVDIIFNHADFRLMSKRALNGLSQYNEVNLFLRGIVPMIGYKTTIVNYEQAKRFAGHTKYTVKKMLSFAIEGITSLSVRPIRIITILGFLASFFSVCMLVYFLVVYFTGATVAGWATIVISIWGIGGLQLLAIGIIGEYIGKIYLEIKKRPRYIIQDKLIKDTDEDI